MARIFGRSPTHSSSDYLPKRKCSFFLQTATRLLLVLNSVVCPLCVCFTPWVFIVLSLGRAVYVYCVIPISIAPSGNSDMTFSIDGQVSGTYVHGPPGVTGGYKYDTLVFSHSLSPGSHKLDITNGRIGTTLNPAGMILDRIVYSWVLGTYSRRWRCVNL